MDTSKIEPKILPLVLAINDTELFQTFSSCQGHYNEEDQDQYMDRNHADVRFDPLENVSLEQIEHFITYLITEFNKEHGFTPMMLDSFKLYVPDNELRPNFVFVIRLEPFDRSISSDQKRSNTDMAILQAAGVANEYNKKFLRD